MSAASQGYTDIAKYEAARKRYRQGAKFKAARIRYRQRANGKATHRRDSAKWISKNPLKHRAHKMVAYAIKRGYMTRKPCVICGAVFTHAHHLDYSKPYDVTWLCHVHHMNEHQKEGEG